MNEEKKSYLSNIKSIIKQGSDKLKEKFPSIFQKHLPNTPTKMQVKENSITEKKPIFTIEEDEDHKVYNYHAEDDEDDYDYVEDTEEIQEEEKKSDNDKKKKADSEKHELNRTNDTEDFDSFDPHTICHRLYLKDTFIDLDGICYIKCKRLKTTNKIFSMIGVLFIKIV